MYFFRCAEIIFAHHCGHQLVVCEYRNAAITACNDLLGHMPQSQREHHLCGVSVVALDLDLWKLETILDSGMIWKMIPANVVIIGLLY